DVCERCNSGWMRELEDRVRPILAPMIRTPRDIAVRLGIPEPRQIDSIAQKIIGQWAYKMVLTVDLMQQPSERFFFELERNEFRQSLTVPDHIQIWLSCFIDEHISTLFDRRLNGPRDFGEAYCMTVTIGHVALQVFGVRPIEQSRHVRLNPAP